MRIHKKSFAQRIYKLPWLSVLLSAVSAVLGVVAGPVIESLHPPFFQQSNLPYLAFLLSCALFFFVALYVLTSGERVSSQVASISRNIAEIAASLDVRVRFMPIGRGNAIALYQHLAAIMAMAEREILIVNYGAARRAKEGLSFDKGVSVSNERKQYYEILAQKIQKSERGELKFKRIVQMADIASGEWLKTSDALALRHNLLLAQVGEKRPEFASLRKSEIFFDTTFAIIDRRYVILALDAIDPEDNEYYVVGHLLFDDPEGRLVGEFVKLFERVEAYSVLVRPSEILEYLAGLRSA